MPTAASLRWPSAVIQSVLQGGASWVATVTRSKPARFSRPGGRRRSRASRAAAVSRGDRDDGSRPSRIIDRTEDAEVRNRQHGHLRVGRGGGDVVAGVRFAGVTMSRPGECGRRTGAPRGYSPSPRYARRRGRGGGAAADGRRGAAAGRSRSAVASTVSRIASNASGSRCRGVGIGPEQLPGQRPQGVEASRAFACERGAVAEPYHPARRVISVVGELVDPLGGDRGEHRVRGGCSDSNSASRHVENSSRRTTSSAKSRSACSASRTFLNSFSSRKNASSSSVWPTIPAGPGEEHPRLPEQVERDVGDRRLFFELGQPGHPLLQPVAVDQRVVAEGEAVAGQRPGSRPSGTDVSMPSRGSVNPVPNAQRRPRRGPPRGGRRGCRDRCSLSVAVSNVRDVVGDVVERRVPVHLVAGRLEERVLLVRA